MAQPVRSRLLLLTCLTTLVVAGGGCSQERADPPPPPPDTSDAQVSDGLARLWAGDNPTTEDTEAAACFAEEFSSRVSQEKLRETGIIDASDSVVSALPVLDPELARQWVDAQFTCVDYVEESTRAVRIQSKGALDPAAYAECLADEINDEQIRTALVAGLSGNPDDSSLDVLGQAQLRCAQAAR